MTRNDILRALAADSFWVLNTTGSGSFIDMLAMLCERTEFFGIQQGD